MKKQTILILVSLLVILVSLVTSCFSTPSTGTSSISTQTSSPITSPTSNTETSQTTGSGTLHLEDSGPITLDPAAAAEAGSFSYIVQIFSGLMRIDENLNIVPDIAGSWDMSPDGKTYTFHLLNNVTFQDGNPVTAADFKYSWERALSPATGSITAGTYLNDIIGASDILAGNTTTLSGVKVVDNYTLQVTIDDVKSYFIYKMAYPTAFVVEKKNVESGSTWWQKPVGTGPFKLKSWQADQSLVLARNDTYYGTRAKLAEVDFQLYSGNPIQLYQEGSIDVSSVYSAYMGLVTDPSNSISKELHIFSDLSIYYIGFNSTTPPFDDPLVRQAFTYAIDKERVISLSTDNVVTTAYGFLPSGMPGYDQDLQGLHFDPEKAKQLIAASKYGSVANLPSITLTTSGWGNNISGLLGGLIEEWRRNLGVEVSVRQLEPDYVSYVINQEKNEMFDSGWSADYPDPQDFLDILFRTGSQNNSGGYSNSQLDTLLDQAAVEQNTDKRLALYQQAEQLIVSDAAAIPLFFGRNYLLVKPYVKDYMLSPLGYPILSKVSIEK